jgi:phenylalanyl-tRNA synthetase alpha chain
MQDLSALKTEAEQAVNAAESLQSLDDARVKLLGKTGIISAQMKQIATLPPEERKDFGAAVNQLKEQVSSLITTKKETLEQAEMNARLAGEQIDITLPIRPEQKGSIHPISQVIQECVAILGTMGFKVAEGPEIEDDFHNFTALNIPESHPARQMHDTFYMKEGKEQYVLRTHTSPVQIRVMENSKPPFKIIAPGRTYRCDSDITHSPMFHQIEGLYIDKGASMAQLKGCLIELVETFFAKSDIPVRFRPSFFPFTEPSAEMDIGYARTKEGISIGAGESWMEILGCGMVHPNVLKNVGLDPEEYQGFAFGIGVERMAMLKYGIPDLRTFFDGDVRWLDHYNFAPLDIPNLVKGLI